MNGIAQDKRCADGKSAARGAQAEADRQEARPIGYACSSDVAGHPVRKRHGSGEGRDESDHFRLHRSGSFVEGWFWGR